MVKEKAPRIVLNDDYVDLRHHCGPNGEFISNRKTTDLNNESGYEKELINCGLKNLVSKFNNTRDIYQRSQGMNKRRKYRRESSMIDTRLQSRKKQENINYLKSQSELKLHCEKSKNRGTSTPALRKSMGNILKACHRKEVKNQTSTNIIERQIKPYRTERSRSMSVSRENHERHRPDNVSNETFTNHKARHRVDSRLREKYSVLNVPWKRSWTIPVFSARQGASNKNQFDSLDRQTYVYDDGTEVDSAYANPKKTLCKGSPYVCMPLIYIGGALCGILFVSFIVFIVFGNEFLELIFQPRIVHNGKFKRYTKLIGGSIIYVITSFFRSVVRILAIPAQDVYQSQPEYNRWTINPT